LGRIDHQVKIRGYRVELGEIEQAILALPGVAEATVLARKDDSGENALYGFYAAPADVREEKVHARLAARIPSFMLPGRLVRVDAMPLTPSGKVDRKQLERLLDRPQMEVPVAVPVEVPVDDGVDDEITTSVLDMIAASRDGAS